MPRTGPLLHRLAANRLNSLSSVPFPERAKFDLDETNPVHIHQHALDITGDALAMDDFETFSQFFHLPHLVETFAAQSFIATLDDLNIVFRNSRRIHEERGVKRRIRDCIAASFTGENTLQGTHVSRIMNGNHQLRDAVPSQSTFERIDGVWLMTRSSYALEESDRPYDQLLTRNGKPLPLSQS